MGQDSWELDELEVISMIILLLRFFCNWPSVHAHACAEFASCFMTVCMPQI